MNEFWRRLLVLFRQRKLEHDNQSRILLISERHHRIER